MSIVNSATERMAHEKKLKIDSPTIVRWTNSGLEIQGKGKIVKINDRSYIVELTEEVKVGVARGTAIKWDKGQRIKVSRWPDCTELNCVSPLEGWSWEKTITGRTPTEPPMQNIRPSADPVV